MKFIQSAVIVLLLAPVTVMAQQNPEDLFVSVMKEKLAKDEAESSEFTEEQLDCVLRGMFQSLQDDQKALIQLILENAERNPELDVDQAGAQLSALYDPEGAITQSMDATLTPESLNALKQQCIIP